MRILKYKKWYLLISLLVLVPGIISLFMFGLNFAVDFTGGSVFEFDFGRHDVVQAELSEIFSENSVSVDELSVMGDNRILVRTVPVDAEQNDKIADAILDKYEDSRQISFETIGPSIGKETTRKSLVALAVASLGIVLYIAYAFRNIPKPYSSIKFGLSAIIAMLHDSLLVIGVFSILGHFTSIEIDALFITAILTVIGFSVHDTIVVFDRIRENLSKLPKKWSFERVVDYSIQETLNRSLATSLTVVITLFALFMLGGESIKDFVLALLIGIVSGTYSSIFTASPILVYWENRKV